MDVTLNEDRLCSSGSNRITTNYLVTGSLLFSAESATEPVTLAEAKAYMHIGFSDDDALISMLIKGAREWVEKQTGCSLISRTVTCTIQVANRFELPYGPVNGTVTGAEAATVTTGEFKAVVGYGIFDVSYSAGYAVVPSSLKLAILARTLDTYENRGEADKVTHSLTARNLLRPFKRLRGWV